MSLLYYTHSFLAMQCHYLFFKKIGKNGCVTVWYRLAKMEPAVRWRRCRI